MVRTRGYLDFLSSSFPRTLRGCETSETGPIVRYLCPEIYTSGQRGSSIFAAREGRPFVSLRPFCIIARLKYRAEAVEAQSRPPSFSPVPASLSSRETFPSSTDRLLRFSLHSTSVRSGSGTFRLPGRMAENEISASEACSNFCRERSGTRVPLLDRANGRSRTVLPF